MKPSLQMTDIVGFVSQQTKMTQKLGSETQNGLSLATVKEPQNGYIRDVYNDGLMRNSVEILSEMSNVHNAKQHT